MDDFEKLLESEKTSAERYVRFRIGSGADADDVLQEVYLAAFRKFPALKNRDSFGPWLISIARNKCSDYFRQKASRNEIQADEWEAGALSDSRRGDSAASAVRETLLRLGDKDKQILYLYFWKEMPQSEIAEKLHIPLGTVKSRLFTAKNNFREKYPYPFPYPHPPEPKKVRETKGVHTMGKLPGKLPETLPGYTIRKSGGEPFAVKWEEIMGWFLVPKPGEKLSWGMYDLPSRKCDTAYEMQVTGKARVNGIDGVEITAKGTDVSGASKAGDYTFVSQLTETHCRLLAASYEEEDTHVCYTYDHEDFLTNWGYGYRNSGNTTDLTAKGDIVRNGNSVESTDKDYLVDIVGRYAVTICKKEFDTVCVMDLETYNPGVVTEQFLDRNGRTILWRRFNRDDWAIDRYKKRWTEQLPGNERLSVNGKTYVHWYDCITDYIF